MKLFIIALSFFATRAEAAQLGVECTFDSSQSMTTGLTAGGEAFNGMWLSLNTTYQRTPPTNETYYAQIGLSSALTSFLRAGLTVSGSHAPSLFFSTGAGLSLDWSISSGTIVTTAAEVTRYGFSDGNSAFQLAYTLGVSQRLVEGMTLAGTYTYYAYADAHGSLRDIPELVVKWKSPTPFGAIGSMPYDLWAVSLQLEPSTQWVVTLQISSVLIASSSLRIPAAEVGLKYLTETGFSFGILGGASQARGEPVLQRMGLSFGVSW